MERENWRPGNMLYPLPAVMVSVADKSGKPNIITVAWAGTVCSNPPMVSISVRPDRYSYHMIEETGEFVINLTTKKLAYATDYCGVKSGRDVDKFKEMGLHAREVEGFPAPALDEAPAFLCCRVKQRIPLGSHDVFLCAVEQVYVSDKLFDENGGLHLDRADLIAYAHGEYHPIRPRPEGFFGYSVARPEVLERRLGKAASASKPKKSPAARGGKHK